MLIHNVCVVYLEEKIQSEFIIPVNILPNFSNHHQSSSLDCRNNKVLNILNCNVSDSDLLNATSTITIDKSTPCHNVKVLKSLQVYESGNVEIIDKCFFQFKKLSKLWIFDKN